MIGVKKPKRSAPKELSAKDENGKTECQRAIDFYASEANRQEAFPFRAYRARAVREQLDKMFHEKCAYCESIYGGTQPCDIEHFRPKGAVDIEGKRSKPGYYWLAADWSRWPTPSPPSRGNCRKNIGCS